jgi:hypothetical protein
MLYKKSPKIRHKNNHRSLKHVDEIGTGICPKNSKRKRPDTPRGGLVGDR